MKVHIARIFTSAEHHYFTRKKFEIGNAPTYELDEIELEPGRGIKGDRFEFSKYPITFISHEVVEAVCSTLELPYDPLLFRRNIVVSGINLNQLIGKRFLIGDVEFEGIAHCAPCTWMDATMKKGAYRLMAGRGGLRAKVLCKGILRRGEAEICTEDELKFMDPLEALSKPRLP